MRSSSSCCNDLISAWTPQYWNFWLGIFLVLLVLVGRERLLRRGLAAKGAAMTGSAATTVLETRGLLKRFGGITPTHDVSIRVARGARHALIGPERRRKTTLINS